MFDRPTAILARLKAPLCLALAVGLTWFAFEALLYRSGAYFRIAEPDSNTGIVVTKLALLDGEYRPEARNVLVFGDSRVAEGFWSRRAGAADPSLNFINVSVPGSTPRTWYYLLREIERRGHAFDAVVVGTLYQNQNAGLFANWSLDAAHATPLLGLRDAGTFPATFEAPQRQQQARDAVLFPALALRQDTLALLQAPRERWRSVREGRPGYLLAVREREGREETMPPLRFAPDRSVSDWAGATQEQRELVRAHLADPVVPPAGIAAANDAFLGHWLGAMAELAHARGAAMLVYPLPRGPYPEVLAPLQAQPPASLRKLRDEAGVKVLPADLLADLESPAHFFDTLHANRVGRAITSDRIGAATRALLGETSSP